MNLLLSLALAALSQAPVNDADWTPRPVGKGEPWEAHTDRDWIDKRFQQMDTGPFLNCSLEYPYGINAVRVTRATAIKVGAKGEATMIFDRNLMRWAAGWSDGFLDLSDRRFGLLNIALPKGKMAFATPAIPGWGDGATKTAPTRPWPAERAAFQGLYLNGARTVIKMNVDGVPVWEAPRHQKAGDIDVFLRDLKIGPTTKRLRLLIGAFPQDIALEKSDRANVFLSSKSPDGNVTIGGVLGLSPKLAELSAQGAALYLDVAPGNRPATFTLLIAKGRAESRPAFDRAFQDAAPLDLDALLAPAAARWKPLATQGATAKNDAPLVVDSLTIPHDNPYKALLFLSGVDFLPNRNLAVAAAHGDVWLVSGVDDSLQKLTWRRFATGLYQPLGLRVAGGKIHVLERGQLTRLHDTNDDGEADYYENVGSDWHVGHGAHSFDTCLETDPLGNFYFFKTGDTETPTGGCLMRISPDGKKTEIFATGFRHPIGLGISPTGYITGADQEGNWMPATRIDHYRHGGFYGDMRAHHRPLPPKIYDPPICWAPRQVDNSAGGQVWVPKGSWGPLSERCLHMSYGRCNLHLLSKEDVGDVPQGGLIDLKVNFTSGVFTGRFNPSDGHLYLAGLRGWQNAAKDDGCLQRVRYTGKPIVAPLDVKVRKEGLVIAFSQPLDKRAAENVANYRLAEWNYLWREEYGSKRYSVKNPKMEGQDDVPVTGARLLDEKTVLLTLANLHPVMQMQIGYNLRAHAGETLVGSIYNTINIVPK
jgi:hypothetical protein